MTAPSRTHVAAPFHLLARPRLNVTVVDELSDDALRRTQAEIIDLVRVRGLPELGRILDALCEGEVPAHERTLDLVSHATSAGFLWLGSSLLEPDDRELAGFLRDHRAALARLLVTRLRLIGCYTGHGERAAVVLRFIAERLGGIAVYGCRDFIDESNFDVDGFAPKWDGLLVAPESGT